MQEASLAGMAESWLASQPWRERAKASASAVRTQRGIDKAHFAAIGRQPQGHPPGVGQAADRHGQFALAHCRRGSSPGERFSQSSIGVLPIVFLPLLAGPGQCDVPAGRQNPHRWPCR